MSFNVQIKADPSQFVSGIDKAIAEATKLEDRGKQAGDRVTDGLKRSGRAADALAKSFAGLGRAILSEGLSPAARGFDSLAEAIRREGAALQRTDEIHRRLAWEPLNQALKREGDMLELINGPMREYEQSLAALDRLLGRDAISTEQYAEQVRVLNQQLERGSTIRVASAAAPATKEKEGFLARAVGDMGKDATRLATGIIGFEGVKLVTEWADAYIEVENRIKSVTTSQDDLNRVMSATESIAQDTRNTWGTVAKMYQRIQSSTRELNLSESQLLTLTKEISEATKLSGSSSQEAAMSMMELTHAFSVGTLMGQSFKVLMKDDTAMMHELQMASGLSQAEFEKLGMSGKITAQQLIEWFGKAGGEIDNKFQRTTATASDLWTEFKNEMSREVGNLGHTVTNAFSQTYDDEARLMGAIDHLFGQRSLADNKALADAYSRLKSNANEVIDEAKLVDNELRSIASIEFQTSPLGELAKNLMLDAKASEDAHAKVEKLKDGFDELIASGRNAAATLAELTTYAQQFGDAAGNMDAAATKMQRDAILAMIKANDMADSFGDMLYKQHESAMNTLNTLADLSNMLNHGHLSMKDYIKDIEQLTHTTETHAKHVHHLTDMERAEQKIDEDLHGAQKQQELMLAALTNRWIAGRLSLADYNKELAKYRDLSVVDQGYGSFGADDAFKKQVMGLSVPGESASASTKQDPKKLTEAWKRELAAYEKQVQSVSKALESVFDPVEQGIDNLFKTGTLNIKEMGAQILDILTQMILKMGEMQLIKAIAPSVATLGFAHGGDVDIPHAANGLGGTFAGPPGTDRLLFMARVTAGEHVSIRTPQQMAAQQMPVVVPAPVVHVHYHQDPRDITAAMASPAGQRATVQNVRRNRGAVRGVLGRR